MNDKQITAIARNLKLQKKKVLKFNEIKSFLETNRNVLGVSERLSTRECIETLIAAKTVAVIELSLGARKEKRFILGQPTPYEVALLLRPNSYFTHQTAVHLNGLLTNAPKTIYVNSEQPEKYRYDDGLEQQSIDSAFRSEQRQSKSHTIFNGKEIRLLSGMNTGGLGVVETHRDGATLRYTDLERTLIDITVRPAYSGGVAEVLAAYKKASGKLSLRKLIEYLSRLDYRYPYHQAIGFYLDQTNRFHADELQPLRQIGLDYDFYLTHAMDRTRFSREWRIHYPEELSPYLSNRTSRPQS